MAHYWQSPYITWQKEPPIGSAVLLCDVRAARQKAFVAAVVEALCLLHDLQPIPVLAGPGQEQRGRFRLALPVESIAAALPRLPLLGYTEAVTMAIPAANADQEGARVTWRGNFFVLQTVYQENAEAQRERAPDRRVFLLENAQGEVNAVQGYRGDGTTFGRRGLPVTDARLLVNLAERTNRKPLAQEARLLDPCAGIGGIVLEALYHRCRVFSGDVDPILRFGLAHLGARHSVASADELPFPEAAFDMIAAEPPYDPEIRPRIAGMLREWVRVLRTDGCLTILCVTWQAEMLRELALDLPLRCYLDVPIDRKGLEVVVLAWQN